MRAEANILPVQMYSKIFPDHVNSDGTSNTQYLDYANIEFECSKNTVIDCPDAYIWTLHFQKKSCKLVNSC